MKKRCLCLLTLLICLTGGTALGEDAAKYAARANREFHIRQSPDDSARRVANVQPKTLVEVLEWGTEWCAVRLARVTGYARTRWLSMFRSLDPARCPVPAYPAQAGIARLKRPVFLTVPGYGGNELAGGSLVSVRRLTEKGADISMMREEAELPGDSFEFQPYVPWGKAEPGDMISGYTTFFNSETGGRLASNRAYNIGLALSRMTGRIIGPGERFSFNALCGPYKKFNGYALAPNISEDGVGYGGGVCQLSTTLFLAVLGLPAEIADWSLHRERGVDYVPQGFDAAVGSFSDLAFVSRLPYTIRLEALAQEGALTVIVYRR